LPYGGRKTNMLAHIVKILERKKIFRRGRKRNEDRALGMLLYGYGLSYTKAGEIVGVSHEAVEQDKRMVSERKRTV